MLNSSRRCFENSVLCLASTTILPICKVWSQSVPGVEIYSRRFRVERSRLCSPETILWVGFCSRETVCGLGFVLARLSCGLNFILERRPVVWISFSRDVLWSEFHLRETVPNFASWNVLWSEFYSRETSCGLNFILERRPVVWISLSWGCHVVRGFCSRHATVVRIHQCLARSIRHRRNKMTTRQSQDSRVKFDSYAHVVYIAEKKSGLENDTWSSTCESCGTERCTS